MNLIQKGLTVAYDIHKNQKRKGSDYPYFVHILDVTKYLMYETKDEEIICAGILHDSLEETKYTTEEIIKEFGNRVYELVNFCTEPENTPDATEEEQKLSWKRRKQHSINSLELASEDEILVFIADKVSNLLSMNEDLVNGNEVWGKFNAKKEEIKWYYYSIRKTVQDKIKSRRIYKIFDNLLEIFENEST